MVSGCGRDRRTTSLTEGTWGGAVDPACCASSRGSSVTCTWREIGAGVSHRW
jgi:hypothetical protein